MSEVVQQQPLVLLEDKDEIIVPEIPEGYGEWEEYREYIRKVRCAICQHTRETDMNGDPIEEIETAPSLVRVSDAHHLTSKGARGPDAENLVPLCRVHHTEFHAMGVDSFQLHYNFNLGSAARLLFVRFFETFEGREHAQIAKAKHQRILSRVHHLKNEVKEIGEMLLDFRENRQGDKRPYEWLGFTRFDQWVAAPISAGGCGISVRSAWRYQNVAKLYRAFPDRQEDVSEIGLMKANTIATMVDKAESDTEKAEILSRAQASSTADLIAWKEEKTTGCDPREKLRDDICSMLFEFLNEFGVGEADEDALRKWALKTMQIVEPRKYGNDRYS